MCLNPITIRNKSKYFNRSTLHKIDMQVPCGVCAECIIAKRNEYYFRSYYQALETWSKDGYCLFDTLTYDNEHVPHINDFISEDYAKFPEEYNFTCFDYTDVRLFFVRLRRMLEYHGFDVKNKLKYFLCSEYGEDPRYTHRPHYHVMFYITGDLDPVILSDYIDKCWQNGITDGVNYKGESYVKSKRVFSTGSDELHMRAVCNYIGKYMSKDSTFTKVVNARIVQLRKWIIAKQESDMYNAPVFWLDLFHKDVDGEYAFDKIKLSGKDKLTGANKQYLKDLKRHVSQFTRQSQGFGIYMIDKLGKDWIFEHNCVEMPDKDTVVKQIPIPQYISTKLFKEKCVDFNGDVYYRWSEYGNKFREYHSYEAMRSIVNKFNDFFEKTNLINAGFEDYEINRILNLRDKFLSGYNAKDLFYYQKFVRGRLFIPEGDEEPDFDSFYYIDQHSMLDNSSISREEFFDSMDDDIVYIRDSYVYKDSNFDKLLEYYNKWRKQANKKVQNTFDFKEDLLRRFKSIGIVGSNVYDITGKL